MMGSNAQQAPLCRLRQVIPDPPHTCSKWIHGGFRTEICFISRLTRDFKNFDLKVCFCQKLRFVYKNRTVLYSRLFCRLVSFGVFWKYLFCFKCLAVTKMFCCLFIFKNFSVLTKTEQKCKTQSF